MIMSWPMCCTSSVASIGRGIVGREFARAAIGGGHRASTNCCNVCLYHLVLHINGSLYPLITRRESVLWL